MEEAKLAPKNFIEEFIQQDIQEKGLSHIQTRFPPEPNGYLHIGHVKALYIDFSMAEKFGGKCNLRFDDTNPTKEKEEFVDAIEYDIRWLGFDWDKLCYGSDYFDACFELAVKLIKKGVAYVDDLSKDEMREYRGTLTEPGKNSPYRDRSVEENLDLFYRMRDGEFEDGARTLRAKIDMASPNINMRDPAIYRIKHVAHHHTGTKWCIYPMYDFAHPIQDAIEGVTHSLCSLEYEAHRPLYNWVIEQCEFEHKPRQIEFARLNLTNTIMSKRYLRRLVEEHYVSGWDDPRMPTLCGLRRRGYSPESIRKFVDMIGYTRFDALNDYAMLEAAAREDLNARALRVSAVIDPVKLVITNYPEGQTEEMEAQNNPERPEDGSHTLTFSRELWIERADFMEDAPKKFFRMVPGKEVRLKNAYIVMCTGCKKDADGRVTEIYATYDPLSRSGLEGANRKVKGTLHWLSCNHCLPAEVRIYDRLFTVENPGADERDFRELLNPDSLQVLKGCYVEPFAAHNELHNPYLQFQRTGYFTLDKYATPEHLVFNRTVALKDNAKGKI